MVGGRGEGAGNTALSLLAAAGSGPAAGQRRSLPQLGGLAALGHRRLDRLRVQPRALDHHLRACEGRGGAG